MNRFWENIKSLLILILVIIILLLSKCSGNGAGILLNRNRQPLEPKVITKIDTVWEKVEIEKEVYVPKWRTKVVTEHDTVKVVVNVPQDIDTLSILRDYYSQYVYVDTLFLDSLGFIAITDTISKNSILSRKPDFNISIPTKIIDNTIYINEREFFVGLSSRLSGKNDDNERGKIDYMGIEGLLKDKKGNVFLIGVGTNQQNNLSVGGGVYWKIGKK